MNLAISHDHVTASVVLDKYDIAKPFDKQSKKELRDIAKSEGFCFARDIDAHETIPIRFVDGRWKKAPLPEAGLES
ncbi:MAG: hypothetical protein COA42_02520 [Alteromonadaceae bacterium]|nr:MAG: hypothetical protein COA42_02520 [Alteromonadaceae bacterium]